VIEQAPARGEDLDQVLATRILDVPDYPKPGVVFKDITPLLADPEAFASVVAAIADQVAATGATKVAGLEARGFILAAPVALAAGVGFVRSARPASSRARPSRPTTSSNTHRDHRGPPGRLRPGERVLVVDDILATGGTASRPRRWSARPARCVGLAVLMELGFLAGRAKVVAAEPDLASARSWWCDGQVGLLAYAMTVGDGTITNRATSLQLSRIP